MALAAEVLTEEGELNPYLEQWDDLANRLSAPYSTPSWMLAWWRHASPPGAALRTVVALEDGRLLGIAPLWVADPRRGTAHYDVLAARLSLPASWLVDPSRAAEVTAALTRALAASRPRPTLLRIEDSGASRAAITTEIVASWPGPPPNLQITESVPMPLAQLDDGGYQGWLERRSSGFRGQLRRRGRRIAESEGQFSLVGPAELRPAIDAYIDLHAARWGQRGGSSVLIPGIREMLLEVGERRTPQSNLRVFTLALDERIAAAEVLVAAGEEVTAWSGGFDEDLARLAPSTQLLVRAVQDACERGETRLSLGPGGQAYKQQLADAADVMEVRKLMPRGRHYPALRLRQARDWLRTGGLGRLARRDRQR